MYVFCHTIALLMIYSCSGGKSNKRSDVSKYCILYNWMNSGEDIMVLIDHLKRQLRNHGTSICRKVCLEVLKEAWTPRERFQSSSIATNRTSVLQSSAASKDVFFCGCLMIFVYVLNYFVNSPWIWSK